MSEELYVLMKRGLYYKPDSLGYTGIRDHAGRYTRDEITNLVDGVTALRLDEAPEYSPQCFSDVKADHIAAKMESLLSAAEARAEAAEARVKAAQGEADMIRACCDMFERAINEGDPKAELIIRVQEIRETALRPTLSAEDRARVGEVRERHEAWQKSYDDDRYYSSPNGYPKPKAQNGLQAHYDRATLLSLIDKLTEAG